jgi:SAM-dependent methyltransferase
MKGYEAETYGERLAVIYDDWYERAVDPRPAAVFLAGLLAPGQRRDALELGVGTGRVALALQLLGVTVTGVDASPAMLGRLHEKPGADNVKTVLGDFSQVPVDGTFPLIYVAFNTFFWLPDQATQLKCLRNVARHLEPDGHFVLDAFVPDVTPYPGGQRMTVTEILGPSASLDVSRHDPVNQTITGTHVVVTENRAPRLYPIVIRYAWPAEIDALAAAAGLVLVDRWADYERQRFDVSSHEHVSVYKPAG